MSKYEEHILEILIKEKIDFIREKTFSDLKKGKYRFDFYLPKSNICIEVDGIQHTQNVSYFYKNKTEFTKQQERDRRKNSYCLAKGIKLYRIPYWAIENIKTFNDILQDSFKVKSKWHNDILKED